MRTQRLLAAVILALGLTAASAPPHELYGFSDSGAALERDAEMRFLDVPSAAGAADAARFLDLRPHYAGTSGDRAVAEWTADRLRDEGFDVKLEAFTSTVDTPRRLVLALYPSGAPGERRTTAFGRPQPSWPGEGIDLREFGTAADPATLDPAVGLPFNAGSGDGDVIAPLVYANHGSEADFATLARAGIAVRGAVLLIRYGDDFRGTVAHRAQRDGAAGVVFYDDPADDGATRGPADPDGPWRPATSTQRGTLGPGITIPVLPVTADNARLLLRALRGPESPASWRGGLDARYPLARGPAAVHLAVTLNRRPTTLWNTIGVLPGRDGGERVVLGAHRDAWVYGVGDNGSGVTTLLEAARGLGALYRGGWRPGRTIVVALWDGEEIGEAGSRAFVREHAPQLDRGAVAYLNADENVTGDAFFAEVTPALRPLVLAAANLVPDPLRDAAPIAQRWIGRGPAPIGPPTGGSDNEAFQDALGVPVAGMGFVGPFGVYHSSYDTYDYAERFSDPQFVLHRATAQLYGIVAMRIADADAIPYAFAPYVDVLRATTVDRTVLRDFARTAHAADAAIARGISPASTIAAVRVLDRGIETTAGYGGTEGADTAAAVRAMRRAVALLRGETSDPR